MLTLLGRSIPFLPVKLAEEIEDVLNHEENHYQTRDSRARRIRNGQPATPPGGE